MATVVVDHLPNINPEIDPLEIGMGRECVFDFRTGRNDKMFELRASIEIFLDTGYIYPIEMKIRQLFASIFEEIEDPRASDVMFALIVKDSHSKLAQ